MKRATLPGVQMEQASLEEVSPLRIIPDRLNASENEASASVERWLYLKRICMWSHNLSSHESGIFKESVSGANYQT